MIEAIPEMAAVAVTRSRCMPISLVSFCLCGILFAYYPSCKHCTKCLGRSWDPIYSCIHRYRLFERLQMPCLVSSVLDQCYIMTDINGNDVSHSKEGCKAGTNLCKKFGVLKFFLLRGEYQHDNRICIGSDALT